jgi:hypothetical protein
MRPILEIQVWRHDEIQRTNPISRVFYMIGSGVMKEEDIGLGDMGPDPYHAVLKRVILVRTIPYDTPAGSPSLRLSSIMRNMPLPC